MYISKTAKRVDFKHSHHKGMISGKVMSIGSIQCFHNVFMYQNITPYPINIYNYLSIQSIFNFFFNFNKTSPNYSEKDGLKLNGSTSFISYQN